jgi:hypothetical protein
MEQGGGKPRPYISACLAHKVWRGGFTIYSSGVWSPLVFLLLV